MSRKEFDTLKKELARSQQETAAVKREVDSWQNSTIFILKQYPIENPGKLTWNLHLIISICIHPTGRRTEKLANCKLTVTVPHICTIAVRKKLAGDFWWLLLSAVWL